MSDGGGWDKRGPSGWDSYTSGRKPDGAAPAPATGTPPAAGTPPATGSGAEAEGAGRARARPSVFGAGASPASVAPRPSGGAPSSFDDPGAGPAPSSPWESAPRAREREPQPAQKPPVASDVLRGRPFRGVDLKDVAAAGAPQRDVLPRIGIASIATLAAVGLGLIYPLVERSRRIWADADWRYSWVFAFLALVPVLWWFGTFGQDFRRPRLRMGTVAALRRGPRGVRTYLRDVPGVLRSVAVAFGVLALARPVSTLSDQTSDEQGIDIMIVMDLSGSMRAVLDADPKDLPNPGELPRNARVTRVDAAKLVVQDFIARRHTDRIGVIVFGKDAYVLSPPTLDYQLLGSLVSKLSLDVIDGSATAIGDALGAGVARMRRSDAASKVVILLTDGDSNAGMVSPEFAIEAAVEKGCKVYTVQIGNGDEVEVQDSVDVFGQPHYVKTRFPVNPELLNRIAQQTGGQAFIATDAKALAQSFHTLLDQLEKTRFEAQIASYEDLFPFLVIPAVALVALDALLRAWLLRRFP